MVFCMCEMEDTYLEEVKHEYGGIRSQDRRTAFLIKKIKKFYRKKFIKNLKKFKKK